MKSKESRMIEVFSLHLLIEQESMTQSSNAFKVRISLVNNGLLNVVVIIIFLDTGT